MSSRVAYYSAAFSVIIIAHSFIFSVKTQSTAQVCENEDTSNIIAEDIQQLKIELFGQLDKAVESMQDFISASFQQFKNQQENAMTGLQEIDRRSQEQVQSIHDVLNASFGQLKSQQAIIDRRSQEKVQSIHDVLNASFGQLKTEHANAMRRLDVVTQLLLYHDISIKNETENSWTLVLGRPIPSPLETGIDLEDGFVLLPSINNWIILMHRFDESVSFSRNWTDYRNGFGNIGRGEFWLGNEKMHRLTSRSVYVLRIEVQQNSSGAWYYAEYTTFSIDSESNNYTLRFSGYSGNAGNRFIDYQYGMSFTTYDVDNDRWPHNCARYDGGGWWFNACAHFCLTCSFGYEFKWSGLGSLRAAKMMIKSK